MDLAWDDLRTILMLVRHKTLAGAAEALGVNYTTVARRVRRAESSLGIDLFERLADGYRPTGSAHVVALHAQAMESEEHTLRRNLRGAEDQLSGTLTITAPQLLISNFLAPVLDKFGRMYPLIDLCVLARNDHLDLKRLEADLAIRISQNPGDTLKGLRLLKQERASFASPLVAERIATDPSAMIDWVVHEKRPFVPSGLKPEYPNNRVRFRFDDMVAMLGAAQAGLGLIRMPIYLGKGAGGLVQVPVLPPQPYTDIWVVGHPEIWPSKKVRAFRDVLVAHCKQNQRIFLAD